MSRRQSQIPDIYKAAITRFEELTGKRLDDPELLQIKTVNGLMKEVDKRNDKFSKFREKRHTFFNVLEGAMKPIELVGNLAAGAASMAFPPSSLVFGAATYLIGAAKGTSASYDAIQDLMGTLKDFTTRLSVYAREEISKELSEKLTEVLTALIEIFALSRKAIKDGRFLKFARNVFLGNDDAIGAAVGKLAKLTEGEQRLVGADTLTEVKRTGRAVDSVSMTVKETNVTVREIGLTVSHVDIGVAELNEKVTNMMLTMDESKAEAKEERDKRHQDSIKSTLRPSVTAQDWYDKINKTRVPGTGDWVRDEGLFKSWVGRNFPVLWVSGNPGAGKSYLSSNIITYLREQNPQGIQHPSHTSVAYYFFKDDNPKTRSFSQALRDISYQICQNDPVYTKHVTAQCDSPEEVESLESAWRSLFADFFLRDNKLDSTAYILFDGVDEAYDAERQAFLQLARDLNEETGRAGIQLVMVGRPQLVDEISEAFEAEVPTIHITSVKNSEDIVNYIQNSINKSTVLKRVPKELQTEIVDKLSGGAQGMFLWVDLMLKELMKKRTPTALRKSLQEAPKGISQMLRHVLEGFSLTLTDEDPNYLNELLAWVTCAQRPLNLGELDTALKLKSEDGEGMFFLEGVLRKQYASFFSLVRDDGLSTADLQNSRGVPADSDSDREEKEEEGYDDVENATDFQSNPTTTEVTLSHASIGDFFRDETQGKVSAGDGYPMVGVNFREAGLSVLKTCLNLFCDEGLREKAKDSPSLLPYAAKNWLLHLRLADPSKASRDDRREIAGLLAKIFRLELCMKFWAVQVTRSFFVEDNVKLIRRWLDYEGIQDDLPEEDREWIKSSAEAPATTFSPLTRFIAQKWLQDPWWIPQNCCWMVYAFINLQKGTPLSEPPSGLSTAQEVLDVAEWAQFEKTAMWHRRLAMVLRECQMYDDALIHFTKALEMDDSMWLARAGIARLHLSKKEYHQAISLDKVNEEILQKILVTDPERSATTKMDLHAVQERMSWCYYELKNNAAALECRQRAFSSNGRCENCSYVCIEFLSEEGRYQDVIDMLKGMEDEVPDKEYSRLTELLWKNPYDNDVFMEMAGAALETNQLQFLIDAYVTAIAAAKKELKIVVASWLELCLAQLAYTYVQDEERAIRIWEKTVKTFSASKVETEIGEVKVKATICLAKHWFQKATEAEKGSLLAQRYADKLERLTKPKVQTASSFISTNTSSVILGLWYRLEGRLEDSQACFRPHVREALQILSDDDPDNDEEGYFTLALTFVAAGDDENAIAILQSIGTWIAEESKKEGEDKGEGEDKKGDDEDKKGDDEDKKGDEEDKKGDDEDKKEGASDEEDSDSESGDNCFCDGPCHRGFSSYGGMEVCRYCYDTAFCSDCFEILKEDKMPMKVCNPKHDWLAIPKLEQKLVAGKLLVGGKLVSLEDWKKELKKQWKL